MNKLALFGKVNLIIGTVLFILGGYLLVEELAAGSFKLTQSMAVVFVSLGISIILTSFIYQNKEKTKRTG